MSMFALAAAININGDRTSQTSRNKDPYLQLPNINVDATKNQPQLHIQKLQVLTYAFNKCYFGA